ncbi:MAG: transposase [bacterium]
MSKSLVQIYLHIVFSTKNRPPYLTDKTLREKVYSYTSGTCKNLSCPALKIGSVEDHVPLMTRHAKTGTISDFMRELTRSSSAWLET